MLHRAHQHPADVRWGEVIRKVVTGNTEDRCQPDNSDFACVYNCHSSTTYVIVTVSFANGDQQGEIVVTPLSTKTANNQPRAAIDDVSYYSDNSNNTYYGWTTKMNTYSKEYYTYAAASPDEFYTYRLMSYEYTPMVAWLLRNEITKNGEDHTTSINVQKSLNWNFNNGSMMTEEDGIYTATFTATVPNTFILFARKLGDGVDWNTRYVFGPSSEGDWVMPADMAEYGGYIDTGDDDPVKLPYAGEYTITINANDNTFKIERLADPVLRGDVNSDGEVDIRDVTALIDYLLDETTVINQANADVDDKQGISITDVTALIDILLDN